MEEEAISRHVVDAALKVHTALGAGLLENVYEACLAYELAKRRLDVKKQLSLPVCYDGMTLDIGYRVDLLVGQRVVVEIKAIERLLPLHVAQVLTYLKLSGYRIGLLLNFNTVYLRDGIRRIVNDP